MWKGALAALFCSVAAYATAAERMALIIGNSDYDAIPDLKNPVNDANALSGALDNLDFEVTQLENSTSEDFWPKLEEFVSDAEDAETVLFFYSGHAFQLDGVNYLVPVDAPLKSRQAIREETWNLDNIIEKLADRSRQTLIFLDACRDSPLPNDVGAGGSGLARLQTGEGTFVAFATEPGRVTYDGTEDNSPFTAALLNHINTPAISISDMMIRVRNDVEEQTFRRQTPWDQSSLRSQFYFVPEFESKPSLTAADFELLANLTEDERARMLALFEAAGIDTTALPDLGEEELNVDVVDEGNLIIAAKPEGKAPVEVPSDDQVVALRPEDVDVVDEIILFPTPKKPDDTEVQPAEATQLAAKTPEPKKPRTVARESVAQAPREVTSQGRVKEISTARAGPATAARPATPSEQIAAATPGTVATARVTGQTVTGSVAGQAVTAAGAGTVSATETGQTVAAAGAGTVTATETNQTVAASSTQLALATSETNTSVQALAAGEALASRIAEDERNAIAAAETLRLASLDTSGLRSLSAVTSELDAILGREILPDSDENRTLLEAIDPDLLRELDPNSPQAPKLSGKELAAAVQTELARLGCYRLRIDGAWGKGSRTAAGRYFLNKKIVPESLEPTVALLRQLKAEGQVQCKNVQVARSTRINKAVSKARAAAPKATTQTTTKKKTVRKITRTSTTTRKTSSGTKTTTKRRIIGGGSGVFR